MIDQLVNNAISAQKNLARAESLLSRYLGEKFEVQLYWDCDLARWAVGKKKQFPKQEEFKFRDRMSALLSFAAQMQKEKQGNG